jgi:hypothetical protein
VECGALQERMMEGQMRLASSTLMATFAFTRQDQAITKHYVARVSACV